MTARLIRVAFLGFLAAALLPLPSFAAEPRRSTTGARPAAMPRPAATSPSAPARSTSQTRYVSGGADALAGTNVYGRSGLLFTDTADVSPTGQGAVSGHLLFGTDDDFDQISLPVGVNYGIADNIEVSANIPFVSVDLDVPAGSGIDDSRSGLGSFTFGGKLRVPGNGRDMPDFGVGLDLAYGPLSDDLGGDGLDFNIKGMVTHRFAGGLLVNGGLGIIRIGEHEIEFTHPVTGQKMTVDSDSDTDLQVNAGLGYGLTPGLTGIAEFAINQFGDDAGVFAVGLRGGSNVRFQGLVGLGIGSDAADVTVGGGVSMGFGG